MSNDIEEGARHLSLSTLKGTMEKLPVELLDTILRFCIVQHPKNSILELRLVCRAFDLVLKQYGCMNLYLDLSRLSKWDRGSLPRREALQTIGYHCKSLYIDLLNLRDEGMSEYVFKARSPFAVKRRRERLKTKIPETKKENVNDNPEEQMRLISWIASWSWLRP